MKIIKFRAWNKAMRRMESWKKILNNDFLSDYGLEFLIDNDDFVLTQFTSITDKNKKEIYTGDIVKYQGRNYEVYFDEKYGCYALKTKTYRGEIEPLGHGGSSTKYSPYLWNWLSKKVEVVGDIYTTPELLK